VGTAISATFLLVIAIINIVFLRRAITERKRSREDYGVSDVTSPSNRLSSQESHVHGRVYGGGMMIRLIGPVLKTVDRPWKLYPVGILFGLGKFYSYSLTYTSEKPLNWQVSTRHRPLRS
jgi:high-affinity nickel-transport protein